MRLSYLDPEKIFVKVGFVTIALSGSILLSGSFVHVERSNSLNQYPQVAQAEYRNQVRRYLEEASRGLRRDGFRQTHNTFIGDLGSGNRTNLELTLSKGVPYIIVGVCDEDCADLDLELLDSNGNLVDSDTESDDTPMVSVNPRWTDRFILRVLMPSCSNSPCWYAVGVFSR